MATTSFIKTLVTENFLQRVEKRVEIEKALVVKGFVASNEQGKATNALVRVNSDRRVYEDQSETRLCDLKIGFCKKLHDLRVEYEYRLFDEIQKYTDRTSGIYAEYLRSRDQSTRDIYQEHYSELHSLQSSHRLHLCEIEKSKWELVMINLERIKLLRAKLFTSNRDMRRDSLRLKELQDQVDSVQEPIRVKQVEIAKHKKVISNFTEKTLPLLTIEKGRQGILQREVHDLEFELEVLVQKKALMLSKVENLRKVWEKIKLREDTAKAVAVLIGESANEEGSSGRSSVATA